MIKISGLNHQIGGAPILSDINLTLPEGQITALIGPNGAGKSTLLKLIGRLEPAQSGRIEIDGAALSATPTADLARRMTILGQTNHVASRLRLSELVGFGRWPHHHGRPGPDDHAIIAAALDRFELTPLRERFLDEVSGGQLQRAFLAMCIAQDTPWLLLDEPLNNLDLGHARALMRHLRDLRSEGRSIVVVVHELNYAASWADHVVAMQNGRIMAEGSPGEVLTGATLGALYQTELNVIEHDGRPLILHH